MQKQLFLFILVASCSVAAFAQTGAATTVPQRDPNPPYGAAAGAAANAGTGRVGGNAPNGVAPASPAQPGTPNATASPPANGSRTGLATAGSSGTPASSGASTSPGATQGAPGERPGATILSRGTTTATGARAAPYDPGSTPGWSMMTPQEQQSYSGRMSSFTSVAQCRAYHAAYLAQIQERARRMGQIVQGQESDPCVALQQQGALK